MRLLDLFCGRWGWSRAFAARGWECVGVDLVAPPEIPQGCEFIEANILDLIVENRWIADSAHVRHTAGWRRWKISSFDFIVASSPCEQFSVHGMPHFHPDPPYPELGIKLFNHTRSLCEAVGVPYVIENVRSAQDFVGQAVAHCGPFYLWGTGVPPIMPQGISKAKWKSNNQHGRRGKPGNFAPELRLPKSVRKPLLATIPPELANCVADYAERLLEQRVTA